MKINSIGNHSIGLKTKKVNFSGTSLISKTAKLTDEKALKILTKELADGMSKQRINHWLNQVKQICKKFDIRPKDLPLNKEHPGNLTDDQNANIVKEICYNLFNDIIPGKVTLIKK